MNRLAALVLLSVATVPAFAGGGETTYHFGTAQNRTNITFESKADIELIVGTSQVVEGSASVDWEAGTARVNLSVPAASMRTGIDMRDEHMRGEQWLNAAKFPAIEFKADKATFVKPSSWTLTGTFAMRGVSKEVTVTADVKQIPAEVAKKAGIGAGDWIRVRSRFDVKLSDYGIKVPEMAASKMADTWNVTLDLFGTTEKPKEVKSMPESEKAKTAKASEVKVEGAGTRFIFGRQPQLTNITAESATDLETVIASTTTVAGVAILDGKGAGKVKLSVPVASLRTGIEMRDDHLRGEHWLDAAKHPDIVFESTKATRNSDGSWAVEGNFSMHGQTKPLSVTVTAKELSAATVKNAMWGETAGLKIRTSFKVKFSDFGVKIPEMAAAKVSDELAITVDAVAISE